MEGGELRGFEWAGLKLAIEVAPGVDPERDWTLPIGFVPVSDASLEGAVRVLLTDASTQRTSLPFEGTAYFHEGDVFEAGRLGSHHWIRRAEDGRIAVASPDFDTVEVLLTTPPARAGFPLAHPLDDIVLLHRALQEGAFALRGAAAVRDGSALVVLGGSELESDPGAGALWHGWLLLRPAASGIDVVPLPSTIRSGRTGRAGSRARLAGLHVVGAMNDEPAPVRVLDADAAAAELLRFAFAPIATSGPDEQVLWAASRIAEWIPVLRLASAGQAAFQWRAEAAAARSALPAGA